MSTPSLEAAIDDVDRTLAALVATVQATPVADRMAACGYLTPRHDGQLVYSTRPLNGESFPVYRITPLRSPA